jgi:asparagine synthase (glutamine-hydrolysing)
VKVGCQLSGGIDSSLVNLFATKHCGADLDAFSIIFDDPQLSEERWIDEAASVAKVNSHKFTLDCQYFIENLLTTTWHLDQPLNPPNSVGIFHLAEEASSIVTVLLSGEGADELLGGYTRFLYAALRPKFHPWLHVLSNLPYAGRLFAKKFSRPKYLDHTEWFIAQSAFQHPDLLLSMRPDAHFDKVLAERRAIFEEGTGDYISNCFKYELRTHLVDLLVRQDKMTMAHSVENRVPFLDHELVTFIRSLPLRYLVETSLRYRQMRMRNTKVLLKKLGLNYYNPNFVYRKKSGFALPLKTYFTHSRFRAIMEAMILPGMHDRGLVNTSVVERWWRSIERGDSAVCESFWICIAFEIWAQQYLDRKRSLGGRMKSANLPTVALFH